MGETLPDRSGTSDLATNLRLYPWYAAVIHAHFWMPVFILYFLAHMPLADVLRLEAIYYLGIVLLEVPSGYFSDRVGRLVTLLIANVALLLAYVTFIVGSMVDAHFAVFIVGQLLLAGGLAFNSGTDTSLHYDSLAAADRASEFDDREARVSRNALLASGLAALVGGGVAMLDLRAAYALSAMAPAAAASVPNPPRGRSFNSGSASACSCGDGCSRGCSRSTWP